MKLKTANLSDHIADIVSEQVYTGRLPAGDRINEVAVARDLGVSRTPLREALQRLVAEDVLEAIPRRGFFVKPLTRKEFSEIYPIRRLLDTEALRTAGLPDKEQIQRLKELNYRLQSIDNAADAIEIDNEWHLELIRHCSNSVLIDLIRQFIRRTRRYELAYFSEIDRPAVASTEHQTIITALEDGNLSESVEALTVNLTSGTQPILEWLSWSSE